MATTADPTGPDPEPWRALNRDGIALARRGRFDEAADRFRAAVRLRPDFPDAYSNLGLAHNFAGRLADAAACLEAARALAPDDPVVLNNLSHVRRELGQLDRAVDLARRAVALRPGYAEAHNNLGAALMLRRQFPDAEACFLRARALHPGLAEAASNLCQVCHLQNRFDDAVGYGREAVRVRPDFAEAHNHLATALAARNEHAAAEACLAEALRLNPGYLLAELNRAHVLLRRSRFDDGEAVCRAALARHGDTPEGHNGLAVILMRQGKLAEARTHFDAAVRLKPDFAAAHLHRGMLRLLEGDFAAGWAEYEWRWRCTAPRPLPAPAWDGSDPAGRTLVVHAEQGVGDTLQFVRYGPVVRRRGATVLLACDPDLEPLLGRSGLVDGFVRPAGPFPAGAAHAGLMSLPYLAGTTADTIPADVPYLAADDALVGRWRAELAGVPGRRVGVVWQGNRYHPEDGHRSFPLARLEPVARVPGVSLVGLQVGDGRDQVAALGGRFPVVDLGDRLVRTPGRFMDAAAVLRTLDVVIACDTAVAHLAGGLGVPAWVVLPFAPDWRWQLGRADSPWYPTVRLFRPARPGDWDGVFERVAAELTQLPARPAG